MTYTVTRLSAKHKQMVEDFCDQCKLAGYTNNSSIEQMKFNGVYDLSEPAVFWAVLEQDKIISVSGCHVINNELRCLFRSATLPEYDRLVPGLSKHHMNSLPFSVLMLHQIEYGLDCGITNFYITTSAGDHDASGKMKRTHRALELLARTGMVDYAGNDTVYNTEQALWKINLDCYLSALRNFTSTRTSIGIEANEEYLNILQNGFSTA